MALGLASVAAAQVADPAMTILRADAASLPLADSCADLVIAFMSLHDMDAMPDAVYCGDFDYKTAPPTWREMAKLADGQYMEIAGNGGAVVLATPFDAKLGELNQKLNGTYVAFRAHGATGLRGSATACQVSRRNANAPGRADQLFAIVGNFDPTVFLTQRQNSSR